MLKGASPQVVSENNPKNRQHLSTIFVVANDVEEFAVERQTLWQDVFPDLQNFAFQSNFDLEICDAPLETGMLTNATVEQVLKQWEENENNWIVCLLGNRYGNVSAPTTLRKEEYDSIRSSLFEMNQDVKILDQCYTLDHSGQTEVYRLLPTVIQDPKIKSKLTKTVQKGATAAHEEGTINQVHENQQKRFFTSPLDSLVRQVLQKSPTRCLFLLRKIEGDKFDEKSSGSYIEKGLQNIRKIEDLKNDVSMKMHDRVMTHVLRPENTDIGYFFNSRESDKYREKIARQFNERLRKHLSETHKSIVPEPSNSAAQIAENEHNIHLEYLSHQLAIGNLPRVCFDKKFDEMAAPKPGVFLIQGPDVCGKTQALCRLYDKISEKNAYKIMRFTNLTYSSNFAHEVWRNIGLTLCQMAKIDSSSFLKQYKLVKIMEILESCVPKLDKPVCIFIDDVHLLKFGHFLSNLEKRVQSSPDKFSLFVTASNVSPVNSVYTINQSVNIDMINEDEMLDMIKKYAERSGRKLNGEQLGALKSEMVMTKDNILVTKVLAHEVMRNRSGPCKGGIDKRLERIENELGNLAVQTVGRYLSVTPHGLTRLELHDVITSQKELLTELNSQSTFPMLLLDNIIEAFGPMLKKIFVDYREVISISHTMFLAYFKHRYLTSTTLLKSTHLAISNLFTELYIDIECMSPRHLISYQNFSQGLKRDNGSANLRKLRLLWYHLLHTGNMDALKELALCHFEYLELTTRYFGAPHLISLYEECAMQVLHHDIQVLCEQVLLPSLATVVVDSEQLAAEVIGRLRFTRAENSHFLNTLVEQAMAWVDLYNLQPLIVPLTCWISPPTMKICRSFVLKDWKPAQTVLAPTQNHQHILIAGDQSTPGAIYMYHVASQILIATFKEHTAAITSLCSSNNGQFFVSTSADKTAKIWSFLSGECVKTLTHHNQKVTCALLTSDDVILITASADSSAKMISVETGAVLRTFNDHTGSVVSLQLTSDDKFLITGSGDFVVQMWDTSNGKCISRMGGLMAPVSTLAITSNDAFVVVACEDETLKVFSTVSGQELHELMGHEGRVNSLVCAQDDCQLFAATKSKIFCYDIHNGQMIDILEMQQPYPIFSLKISLDNYFLVSSCGPRVTVWNVQKRNHDAHDTSMDKDGYVTSYGVSIDERLCACGTYNGVIAVWDLEVCQCSYTVSQCKGIPVTCVSFTVDATYILAGNAVGNIMIVEASTGTIIRFVNMHSVEVKSIVALFSQKVLSCDKDGKLVQWDMRGEDDTPDMIATGVKPPIFVPPSGRLMIGYCQASPKEMRIWSLAEDAVPVQKNKLTHNEDITCFATPLKGGSLVATGSIDMSLKIWQIESGFLTQILAGHDDIVTCCCVSDNERIVISGSRNNKMIVWNVQTGQNICSVSTSSPITAVALTGDGTVGFTSTEAGWVEAWSTDRGQLLSTFNTHRPISNMTSTFDANRLLVHLVGCAQFAILCLHNTPATAQEATRRRSARAQSVSSITNETPGGLGVNSMSTGGDARKDPSSGSTGTGGQTGNGTSGGTSAPRGTIVPRPTFDKLERSKSRTSLIEKDRPTTLTTVAAPIQKSNMCTLL